MPHKQPKKNKQKSTEELIKELRAYNRRWDKIEKAHAIDQSGSIRFIKKELR